MDAVLAIKPKRRYVQYQPLNMQAIHENTQAHTQTNKHTTMQ